MLPQSIVRRLRKSVRRLGRYASASSDDDVAAYLRNGRRPWSRGYESYKTSYIERSISDSSFLDRMARGEELPAGHGEFLDERVVEYPWFLSRVRNTGGRLLDAGSTLNQEFALEHPRLKGKDITIVTLAPEASCFWQKRISYVFADIRDLPFRDNYFDHVVSISTIEHVAKDNAIYTSDRAFRENDGRGFLSAVRELKRVCKPGGKVYITVPYGQYTDFGWYQQFDQALIDKLITEFAPDRVNESYFAYEGGGWRRTRKDACGHLQGFDIHATKHRNPNSIRDYDPDFAAASRGIAALELWKESRS